MENNKIYFFAYDEIENINFFAKLFGIDVINKSARLNGFVKCISLPNRELFLKKDKSSFVKGTLFEITKEQLFLVDKWKMLPKYDRFLVNVILEDDNSIVENVFTYSKIEFDQYDKFEGHEDLVDFDKYRDSFDFFLSMRKNNLSNYDFIFLYKLTQKEIKNIDEIKPTNVFIKIEIHNIENEYNTTYLSCILTPFTENGEKYVALTAFNRNDSLNIISYYEIFNGLNIKSYGKNTNIEFFNINNGMDITFLKNRKPDYFLSNKEDKSIDKIKYGTKKNILELVLPEFNIDHWTRFNALLTFFFDEKKNIEKE